MLKNVIGMIVTLGTTQLRSLMLSMLLILVCSTSSMAQANDEEGRGDPEKDLAKYTALIRLDPKNAGHYLNRGHVWNRKGDNEKAIADYSEAIRLEPENPAAYSYRGGEWNDLGVHEKAIADFNDAIRLDPKEATAYRIRGFLWKDKGDYEKALSDFGDGIRLAPNDPAALSSLGWFLATCPNEKYRSGERAMELATKACELSDWKAGYHLSVLAAACAENGEFEKAVDWQQKAQNLFSEPRHKRGCETVLELYKSGKPYRDQPKRRQRDRRLGGRSSGRCGCR
jgi:tetratricopeptide (TPR) repeat protein